MYVKEVISTLQKVNFRQKKIFENQKNISVPLPQPEDVKMTLTEKKLSDYFTRVLFIKRSHIGVLRFHVVSTWNTRGVFVHDNQSPRFRDVFRTLSNI